MDIESLLTNFVLVVFACIALAYAYNVVRFRGFKGAIFGARIRETIGELELARSGITTTLLRVHVLDGDAAKEVGLELVSKSPLSYHMAPFSLSRNDASVLARLLEDASAPRAVEPRTPPPNSKLKLTRPGFSLELARSWLLRGAFEKCYEISGFMYECEQSHSITCDPINEAVTAHRNLANSGIVDR